MMESREPYSRSESATMIFTLLFPVIVGAALFAMRYEGLQSAARRSGPASQLLPVPLAEFEPDDLDFLE